eukprot:1760629-Prymnesium_polylepis.2
MKVLLLLLLLAQHVAAAPALPPLQAPRAMVEVIHRVDQVACACCDLVAAPSALKDYAPCNAARYTTSACTRRYATV